MSLLETTAAHCSRLAAVRLQAVPYRRSWQLGASWLRPCSLLSPCGWRASKLRPCELVLRLQTLQQVEVKGQVVEAGPGRSGLVP
jgi:hypothetical protein